MKPCKDCGTTAKVPTLDYCTRCWNARKQPGDAVQPQGGADRSPAVWRGTPLDLTCPYEWTFGPMEGQSCGAGPNEACTEGSYAPSIDVRMVNLGDAGRYEVHEARYQAWKAQPVRIYEGME